MTLTQVDAKSLGTTPWGMVKIIKAELPAAIAKVEKEQKSPEKSLATQGATAGGVLAGARSRRDLGFAQRAEL
ncbi:MAG: hypothetical protein ACFBSE_24720 [Prochloraceae cyanobacterium]